MERLVLWHRALPPTRLERDDADALGRWIDQAAARIRATGGALVARVGGTVVGAFELTELAAGIDLALALLDDVERPERDGDPPEADDSGWGGVRPSVSIGLATGELDEGPRGFAGAVLDRAQLLANRARRGEVVVDAVTRDLAGGEFLFDRAVGTGAAALRGTTLDRRTPRRSSCRAAVRHLGPAPVPTVIREALSDVAAAAIAPETRYVLLRGPSGAGSSRYLHDLAARARPALVLQLAGVPSGLEPLGSLRLALRDLDASSLDEVRRGEPLARDVLLARLADLLPKRPWFVLDPLTNLDPSSLEVVAAYAAAHPAFVVARAPVDAPLPRGLDGLPWDEHVLPSLRLDDAKEVAAAILGERTDPDLARRIAVLGGDTPLGVIEAARALVAGGDIVFDGQAFVWRTTPRAGVRAIPLDDLVDERVDSLEGPARALLEACALLPLGTGPEVLSAIARLDGLDEAALEEARERLETEAFAHRDRGAPTSEHLRRAVIQAMPPARRAELERFIATALEAHGPPGPLAAVSRGVALSEGGDGPAAAGLFLAAGQALAVARWTSAARRLAVAAASVDPRPETRSAAATLSRSLGSERPGMPVESVAQAAVNALLAGDLPTVERTVDAAIAEGRDLAAADRVRAMAYLAKGDPSRAMEAFRRLSQSTTREPRARARAALTLAWIQLHEGQATDAVRAGLEALAIVRRLKDPRGETAALNTIAACYRALGRAEDAEALTDAAPG
ncbi:MAG: hypothetical protein KF901_21085 [Myxococcales bacterium]|nr:hypothetical protein [Myxococcales bacterium]